MATSVKPETQQNSESASQDEPQNSQATENQDSASPPTPNNPPAADNSRLLALMEQTLREKHQQVSRLETQLETERQNRSIAQGPTISSEDFWKDPVTNLRKLIKEETEAAVKPLNEFRTKFEAQDEYGRLKNAFRNDPRFKEIFPAIEATVDEMMTGVRDVNANSMQAAFLSAAGAHALGLIPGSSVFSKPAAAAASQQGEPTNNGQTSQPARQSNVNMPAHLRPSGSRINEPQQGTKRRDLTELERRLARENGLTDEAFLDWMDLPPDQVTSSTIGKKPKENPNSQVQHRAG